MNSAFRISLRHGDCHVGLRPPRNCGRQSRPWRGEDHIRAVLNGLAGRDALRGMLARLQPKEEVLLLGWGVPMPLPVRSRRYDDNFWTELLGKKKSGGEKEIKAELGFD